MSRTRRAHVDMDPSEYEALAQLAAARHVSVATLIRAAVRTAYLETRAPRAEAVDQIAAMCLPVDPWPQMKEALEDAYDAGLP